MYSNILSTIATIFSLSNLLELYSTCFSCNISDIQSHKLSGSNCKYIVFEIPEAMIAGDFSNFISVRSRANLSPGPLTSKCISFAKSYNNFLSAKLARSTI